MNFLNRYTAVTKHFKKYLSSLTCEPHTTVLFVSDNANWSLSWDIREISNIAGRLGIPCRFSGPIPFGLPRQSIFFASKYILMNPRRFLFRSSRISFPYFHGYPDSGESVAIECFDNLRKYRNRITRIQVSHSKMRDFILDAGVDPHVIQLIPIGVNMGFFRPQTELSKMKYRKKFGVPSLAPVVGSFQKDGAGWGEGGAPKLIKGPDVFVTAMEILKETMPELFVLLSGPARGYVKNELAKRGIPFRHIYMEEYPQVNELYQCLDAYVVASREEGGPKAILESMASRVPIITTRVGQAMDQVEHRKNGWMVEVGDADGLAHYVQEALTDSELLQDVLDSAYDTACANTYATQILLWKNFFTDIVVS